MRLLLAISLWACVIWACLPATRAAGLRRLAESQVASCIRSSRCLPARIAACYQEAEEWCLSHSMEKLCGEGGPRGECVP